MQDTSNLTIAQRLKKLQDEREREKVISREAVAKALSPSPARIHKAKLNEDEELERLKKSFQTPYLTKNLRNISGLADTLDEQVPSTDPTPGHDMIETGADELMPYQKQLLTTEQTDSI